MYQSSLIVGPLSRCDVSVEVYQSDNRPDCWLLEISTNTGAAGGLPARTRKSGRSGDSFRERSKLAETSAMSRQKSAPGNLVDRLPRNGGWGGRRRAQLAPRSPPLDP